MNPEKNTNWGHVRRGTVLPPVVPRVREPQTEPADLREPLCYWGFGFRGMIVVILTKVLCTEIRATFTSLKT